MVSAVVWQGVASLRDATKKGELGLTKDSLYIHYSRALPIFFLARGVNVRRGATDPL